MSIKEGTKQKQKREAVSGPSFLSQLGGLILLASLLPEEAFRELGPALFGSTAPELVGALTQGQGEGEGEVELTPQFPDIRARQQAITGFRGGTPTFADAEAGGGEGDRGRGGRISTPLGLSNISALRGAGLARGGAGGGAAEPSATPITRDIFSQLFSLLSNLTRPILAESPKPEETMGLSQQALNQALATLGGLL